MIFGVLIFQTPEFSWPFHQNLLTTFGYAHNPTQNFETLPSVSKSENATCQVWKLKGISKKKLNKQ